MKDIQAVNQLQAEAIKYDIGILQKNGREAFNSIASMPSNKIPKRKHWMELLMNMIKKSYLAGKGQGNAEKIDWVAYREAWEELLKCTKELNKYASYLSMEQQRELNTLQEQIRSLKRNRDTFTI